MKEKIIMLCVSCVLPMSGFADSTEEEAAPKDVAIDRPIATAEWRGATETSPSTNPRWKRNPEARKAYLRGDPDYRSYPRQSDQQAGNQSTYYKRGQAQSQPQSNNSKK